MVLSLHNIHDREEQETALRELARVLKPGGRLAIVDNWDTGEYARILHESGMEDVQRSSLRFNIFPPVREVRARKPDLDGSACSGYAADAPARHTGAKAPGYRSSKTGHNATEICTPSELVPTLTLTTVR